MTVRGRTKKKRRGAWMNATSKGRFLSSGGWVIRIARFGYISSTTRIPRRIVEARNHLKTLWK
jgi:hypothetical protein